MASLIKNVNSKKIFGKNLLDLWLENISKVADKIVILDNNSQDGTFEKISKVDNLICEQSNLNFDTHEQHLHSELWKLVKKHAKDGEDMILLLASDEFIDETLIKNKEELISTEEPTRDSYAFHQVHLWDKDKFRIDGSYEFKISPRLFRYRDVPFTTNKLKDGIHNSAFPSYVQFIKNSSIINSCIIHYGYSDKKQRQDKYKRYKIDSLIDKNPKLIPFTAITKLMKNYDVLISRNEWNEIRGLMLG